MPSVGLAGALGEGALAKIRSQIPALSRSDARVANVILQHAEQVPLLTVSDLAKLADTSSSTVVRCCQRLGFSGFQILKLAIAYELRSSDDVVAGPVEMGDAPAEILRKVMSADAEAVKDAMSTIDVRSYTRAAAAIAKAGRVLFSGVGTSAPIAQDAATRFLQIGITSEAPPDALVQHLVAAQLKREDVCFVVSHSGATLETVAVARAAKARRATVIALTTFAHSPLIEAADIHLVAGGNHLTLRLEAISGRIAHMAVVDALFVAVAVAHDERARRMSERSVQVVAEHRF